MKKINVITLGCSKNTVDSEHLMARLAAAGYEVLFDSDRTDAKVVVINTCGFIGDAKQESDRHDSARRGGASRPERSNGCSSWDASRNATPTNCGPRLPEVDDYFGARTWDGIVRALGASEDPALATERHVSTTPKHYAYLKISEGCNWKCGYCAIPLIRGAHVSVPMEELEEEARKLAAGRREGTDRHRAGHDLLRASTSTAGGRLAELLRRLCRIDGIGWIRLHYAYPAGVPRRGDRGDGLGAQDLQVPRHPVPAHLRRTARVDAPPPHQGRGLCELIGRLRGCDPRPGAAHDAAGGLSGRDGSRFRRTAGQFVREVRFERLGRLPLLGGGGHLRQHENLRDDVPETSQAATRGARNGAHRTRSRSKTTAAAWGAPNG